MEAEAVTAAYAREGEEDEHLLATALLRPTPLEQPEIDALRRLARSPHSDTWRRACEVIGVRAAGEPDIHDALHEMLVAPVAEMRLRGAQALTAMAPRQGDVIAAFVEESLSDETLDAVQAEVVMSLLAHLCAERATPLLAAGLAHPRDDIRAAATASLARWTTWPAVDLSPLSRDPSPLVRASLAAALSTEPDIDSASALWQALAASPEAYLRAFVADALRARSAASIEVLEALADDADPLVRDTAAGRPVPAPAVSATSSLFSTLQALEARLDAAPENALETLRDVLATPDALGTLEALSHVTRQRPLAALCRALAVLTAPSTDPPLERTRQAWEAVGPWAHVESAAGISMLLWEALRALDVAQAADIAHWPDDTHLSTAASTSPAAEKGLGFLLDIAGLVQSHGPAEALHVMEERRHRELGHVPHPEGALLQRVLDHWTEVLESEIEQTVSGVSS